MQDRALTRTYIATILVLILVVGVTVLLPAASKAADSTTVVWGWGPSFPDNAASVIRLPVRAAGLTGVSAVSGGWSHALALKSDGTVWAWGSNEWGQIGDGVGIYRTKPKQVPGLAGYMAVGAGRDHSLALKSDGTVWAWGYNYNGELGDGTRTIRQTPVQVLNLTNVKAVAGGYNHNLAIKNDGTVWAWGANHYGQLGDGTTTDRNTPVQVSGLTGVIAVAGGADHSLALKGDGTVWAWGENDSGQLGDGTATDRLTPVQVTGLSGVVSIGAGSMHSVALRGDGTVWAWGENNWGQLGDGTSTIQKLTPVKVSCPTGIQSIAVGAAFSLALRGDGTVWAWGDNGGWQLGENTGFEQGGLCAIPYKNLPVQVHGRPGGSQYLSGVVAIGAGAGFGMAINTDNPYSTTVSVASSKDPASVFRGLLGQMITITATVSAEAPGTGTPTGTVTFWDVSDVYRHPKAPMVLATKPLVDGKATYKVSPLYLYALRLPLGQRPIIAVYNGSTNYGGSNSPEYYQTIVLF